MRFTVVWLSLYNRTYTLQHKISFPDPSLLLSHTLPSSVIHRSSHSSSTTYPHPLRTIFHNMAPNHSSPQLPTYFVLSDSHAKFLPRLITTSSHHIVVNATRGLKWLDNYNESLSALSVLQSSPVSSNIQSATAVLLLIGTNSIRSFNASQVIHQVQTFISLLRTLHPHLTATNSITVVAAFACLKTSFIFPTGSLLQENIRSYNEQLVNLSQRLNFTLIDFDVQEFHLRHDLIHLHSDYDDLVENSICNYFEKLSRQSLVPPVRVHTRSKEAVTRRNRRRHEKFTQLQQQYSICRAIESPWTLQHVKSFLRTNLIRYAKLPPVHKHTIRIQFNNPTDLQVADETLSNDVFSAANFSEQRQP